MCEVETVKLLLEEAVCMGWGGECLGTAEGPAQSLKWELVERALSISVLVWWKTGRTSSGKENNKARKWMDLWQNERII